jgi:WD40 repeat protein
MSKQPPGTPQDTGDENDPCDFVPARISFSADGKQLVIVRETEFGAIETVSVWDVEKEKLDRSDPGHPISRVYPKRPSEPLKRNVIRIKMVVETVDAISGNVEETEIPLSPNLIPFHYGDVSSDGRILLAYDSTSTVHLWDLKNSTEFLPRHAPPKSSINSVALSSNGRLFLACGEFEPGKPPDGFISVWDMKQEIPLWSKEDPRFRIRKAVFSTDATKVALATGDAGMASGEIQIRDSHSGREQLRKANDASGVNAIRFSPEGKTFAYGDWNGTVSICNAQSGDRLFTLVGNQGPIGDLQYSPDGKRLATASYDGSILLWDTSTGRRVAAICPTSIPRSGSKSDSRPAKR